MMAKKLRGGLGVLRAGGMALSCCGESGAAGNDSASDAAGNEAHVARNIVLSATGGDDGHHEE